MVRYKLEPWLNRITNTTLSHCINTSFLDEYCSPILLIELRTTTGKPLPFNECNVRVGLGGRLNCFYASHTL